MRNMPRTTSIYINKLKTPSALPLPPYNNAHLWVPFIIVYLYVAYGVNNKNEVVLIWAKRIKDDLKPINQFEFPKAKHLRCMKAMQLSDLSRYFMENDFVISYPHFIINPRNTQELSMENSTAVF